MAGESGQSSPFYDDFRAEAADLLNHIRRLLSSFRGAKGVGQRDLVSALLRQFHTLKGLTGMVGLKRPGQLTHLIESYLLAQQTSSGTLSEEAVRHLAAASNDLELLIAQPDGQPGVLQRYEQLFGNAAKPDAPAPAQQATADWMAELPPELADALSPTDQQLIAEGLATKSGLALVTFASSPERAERGVKVNDIREALGSRAELVRVVPQVRGRDVSFGFLLLTSFDFDCTDLEVERRDVVAAREVATGAVEETSTLLPSSVRVGTERLEEVARLVESLVVSRYRLDQRINESALRPEVKAPLKETAMQMQRQLRDLTEALMRVRMVPLADILQRLPLLTKELAHDADKKVELVLRGEETRVDKNVVERLLDPLLHLVRNAVAHGIEPPQERLRLGKPECGRITIEAKPDGNSIVIAVADDGRGVDAKKLLAAAHKQGLTVREGDNHALLDLLCESGFSTRTEVGFDAGRGVGMEIVRNSVEAVGGSLKMDTVPGFGTTFRLRLPLTTAIVDALLVESGGATFAIPTQELQEVVDLTDLSRVRLRSSELLKHRGVSLRLYQLPQLLSLTEAGEEGAGLALIYGTGSTAAAFAVDRVSGLREVVVRTFSDPLVVRPWFLGATELGDGRLVLILHLPELLRRAA